MSETVTATTDFNNLYVTCDTISNRDLVALVPGAKWRSDQGHWSLNLTWSSCKQLRSIFGDNLELDDTVIDWATEELNNRIIPCMELRDLLVPSKDLGIDYSSLDPRLYGYQVAGAQFLASANHGILSDPPGAGKTATSISAARLLDALPALVIAPKSTLVSWGREVEQWWPGTNVIIISGTKKQRELQFKQIRGMIEGCELHNVTQNINTMPRGSVGLVTRRTSVNLIQDLQNDNETIIEAGWKQTPNGSETLLRSASNELQNEMQPQLVIKTSCVSTSSPEMNTTNGLNEPIGLVSFVQNQPLVSITTILAVQNEPLVVNALEESSVPCVIETSVQQNETSIGLTEPKCTCPFVIINWELLYRHSRLSAYGSMEMNHCSNCDRASTGSISNCHRCEKELNAIPFKLVIADEAHRMQKAASVQTRTVWHLGDSPSVQYRWALTGTPLTNQIDSLWSILRFIYKEEHPSKVAFIDRYALTRVVPWGSGSEVIGLNPYNEEEFQEIFQPRFRRMPKEIILPQLPPIQRTRRYLQMSDAQRAGYEQMADDMVAVTESGELLIAANPAVKMIRMVQYSSAAVDLLTVPQENDDEEIFIARLVNPSNKLDALMDDLPDLIAAGEQVVVFAVSRQLIEMAETELKKAKIKFSVIKGNQKQDFRQKQIDDFQEGKVPVILVVIQAGGVGITLTAARIGIFLQRSWSFIDNHQAEGRLHRIGSEIHSSIEYIDYISEGTVDQVVADVAEGKELRLEEIVRDGDAIRRLLRGEVDD